MYPCSCQTCTGRYLLQLLFLTECNVDPCAHACAKSAFVRMCPRKGGGGGGGGVQASSRAEAQQREAASGSGLAQVQQQEAERSVAPRNKPFIKNCLPGFYGLQRQFRQVLVNLHSAEYPVWGFHLIVASIALRTTVSTMMLVLLFNSKLVDACCRLPGNALRI